MPPYEFEDPSYSAEVARENTKREMAERRQAQADKDRAVNERRAAQRQIGYGAPKPRAPIASEPTDSAAALVDQAEIGLIQLDRERDKRAARRAAEREKAEQSPEDTRTSAEKLADRFGFGK